MSPLHNVLDEIRAVAVLYRDVELMQMQVEALFVHDANGRLLRVNEPEPTQPAPRFFLTRTAAGCLWRTRHDLPHELSAELDRLAADEPVVTDLRQPPFHDAGYMKLLGEHDPVVSTTSGPAYYLPELAPPENAIPITPENVALMGTYFPWLLTSLSDYAPVVAVVADGVAVAVCFSSRLTPRAASAGVYTEAGYRGRGFAVDVVRGWAAAVRSSGRLPLYDTSWTNVASQKVAKKLGAVQYGANYSIR